MQDFILKNLVFQADKRAVVTAFCHDMSLLDFIEAGYISGDGRMQNGSLPDSFRKFEPVPFEIRGNVLQFDLFLSGEGTHTIKLQYRRNDAAEYVYLEFYSLYSDLYALTPYKGNIHCHTTDSDGLNTPENTLCVARQAGFDFVAFSEHRKFIDHTGDCKHLLDNLGINLFHAEEVHSLPLWVCHILSFGANSGISQRQESAEYKSDVEFAKEKYSDLPEDLREYAAQSDVILRYISEAGGLKIMCHPYWKHTGRINMPAKLNEIFFEKLPFDAMEIASADNANTSLANAKYTELAGNGFNLPVLAGSDWHGQNGERMQAAYNIVFAQKCSESSVADAVRIGNSVAVFGEDNPVVFGSVRLVNYALFLIRNFYSRRDADCEQLGLLMLYSLNCGNSFDKDISGLKASVDLQNFMLKA